MLAALKAIQKIPKKLKSSPTYVLNTEAKVNPPKKKKKRGKTPERIAYDKKLNDYFIKNFNTVLSMKEMADEAGIPVATARDRCAKLGLKFVPKTERIGFLANVWQLLNAGNSYTVTGKLLGVSNDTIYNCRKVLGLVKLTPNSRRLEVKKLMEEGMSRVAIANKLDVNKTTIDSDIVVLGLNTPLLYKSENIQALVIDYYCVQGLSKYKIYTHLGIGRSTLQRIIDLLELERGIYVSCNKRHKEEKPASGKKAVHFCKKSRKG